ncbi:MAG: hypothetical protein J0L62_06550 [Bacteroidetes bacterium]|nr:hypothetical protein [Bacteroidota bacterium]
MKGKDIISPQCKKIVYEICERMGEDMTSPHCKEIMHHIEDCPECKAYLESLKKTVHVYRKTREEIPAGLEERMMELLKHGPGHATP